MIEKRLCNDMLRECIESVLKGILGENAAKAVLFHIQLSQLELPKELHNKLCFIFKDGSIFIEKAIVKDFYQKLNLKCNEEPNFNFEESVNYAKMTLEKKEEERKSLEKVV